MAVTVVRIGDGVYRVDHDGRSDIVYVAGSADGKWAFWNGHQFRAQGSSSPARSKRRHSARESVEAPMPATVIKVMVEVGASVKKGDTLVLIEAMKMELPIRAHADAVVTAVHCRDGARVDAGAVLVDLEE